MRLNTMSGVIYRQSSNSLVRYFAAAKATQQIGALRNKNKFHLLKFDILVNAVPWADNRARPRYF